MEKEKFRQQQRGKLVGMVNEEKAFAVTLHGEFGSPMEGLGVIEEERFEASVELDQMNKFYRDFRHYLQDGVSNATIESVGKMGSQAILAAQELLQVAAMCLKYTESGVLW